MAGINFDINEIRNTGIDIFKKKVKAKMRDVALTYLKNLQQTHSKIKDIKYEKLKIQDYLKSPLFSNSETSLLFSLRSRTAETFKANYIKHVWQHSFMSVKMSTRGYSISPPGMSTPSVRNINE